MEQSQVLEVITRLEKYGSLNHGNKRNPLNEILYIILSKQTDDARFVKAYNELKRRYPSWEGLSKASIDGIASAIYFSGLERQKARHIKELLAVIKGEYSRISLSWLKNLTNEEALDYLVKLPGVGIKSAYCVLMYSLSRDVLPVDVHVFRISSRLGLIGNNVSPLKAHQLLNNIIPPGKRYSYHVNCVSHGRVCCSNRRPKCLDCCILEFCRYGVEIVSQKGGGYVY